ncbi:hypothetical protein FACS1894166_06650 [Bacilli bacterium]|nr:hypothetical protein FACS1894166_06650 [Bacilli bacterium]
MPPMLSGGRYAKVFEDGLKQTNKRDNIIAFFAKLCKTQCFNDGNKRTALIFCNAILVQKNMDVIRVVNHVAFARKLVNYYEDENKIDEFVQYVIETSKISFDRKPIYKQSVGNTIASLMGYYGLNENKLAIITGVDRSHINKIIKGIRKPSIQLAKSIAKALHIR